MELLLGVITIFGDTIFAVILLFLFVKMFISAYKQKLEREEKAKNEQGRPNPKDFRLR